MEKEKKFLSPVGHLGRIQDLVKGGSDWNFRLHYLIVIVV